MPSTNEYSVIVAGAGPVGLTLAIDLGRRGVSCLIMERHPTTLPWPKMDRSNARTMEFYRRIGIVDRVRALGYPPDNPMDVFLTTRLSDQANRGAEIPVGGRAPQTDRRIAEWCLAARTLPTRFAEQAGAVAEGSGRGDARTSPCATVCELVDFTQDAAGVTVQARTVDGAIETLRCDYLAGSDGGTSTVRKQARHQT